MSEDVKRLNPQLFGCDVIRVIPPPSDEIPTVKESLIIQPSKEELKNEKQFQEQVAALLRNRGIVFQRSRMDRKTTGTIGIPDFLFAVPQGEDWGRPCAFELKMPGKHPTEEQSKCIKNMLYNGWDVRIVHSVDEVMSALKSWNIGEMESK